MTKQSFRIKSGRLEYVSILAVAGLFAGMMLAAILEMSGVNPALALLGSFPVIVLVFFVFLFNDDLSRDIYTAFVPLSTIEVGAFIVTIAIGDKSAIILVLAFLTAIFSVISFTGALTLKNSRAD